MRVIAWADGASRGNPGPASYGYVVTDEHGVEVDAGGEVIGRATNNVAEYRGAIAAAQAALRAGADELELRLDSQLVVRQVEGRYRVRNAALKPLYDRLLDLLDEFDDAQMVHVPREQNAHADGLANAALDELRQR